MDTQALRTAYDEFHTAALTHAAPTDASWSAALVIAHIALTDELPAATARALLDGRPAASRARGGSRTHTSLRTADFESAASAIPPLGLVGASMVPTAPVTTDSAVWQSRPRV